MSDTRPGMGHNAPPSPMQLIEIEGLEDRLKRDWKHLFDRKDELIDMVNGWIEDHPNGVVSDEEAGQANDVLAQILTQVDVVDKSPQIGVRADVKRCIIDAGKIVDDVFRAQIADKMRQASEPLKKLLLDYARKLREQADQKRQAAIDAERAMQRREAEEQAERVRREQEANAAAMAAKPIEQMSAAELDALIAAEQAIIDATPSPVQAAVAPIAMPPSKVQIAGDYGSKSHLRGKWVAVVVNAAMVPRNMCRPDQGLIDAAMKAATPSKGGKPALEIPGVELQYQDTISTRRR
jgi:hypothetical protein